VIFLKLFWKEIAIGLIIFICAITVAVMKSQLKSCRADLIETKAQVVILSSAIEKQNAEVEKLGKATKEAKKRSLQAIKKAKLISVQAQDKIKAIESVPVRNSGICEENLGDIRHLLDAAR